MVFLRDILEHPPVDDGIVFADGVSAKWKRKIFVNYLNVKWYPIVENVAMDAIWTQIMAAATNNEFYHEVIIYFPRNSGSGKWYYFTNTITINTKIQIIGETPNVNNIGSYLRWPTNTTGFIFNYYTSRFSIIKSLKLGGGSNAYSSATPYGSDWDATKHGIIGRDILFAKDITVGAFCGSGFYFYGNAPESSNVNNCIFEDCTASQNRLHGFYFQGADANAIKIIRCQAISNGGMGIFDKSFLGNHYMHLHIASNGSPELTWQRGLCKTAGNLVYAAIVDGVVGIEPGVTAGWANSWQLLTGSTWYNFNYVVLYNPATTYYAVGSWALVGSNQYGSMIGCYSESDQAPGFIDQRNTAYSINATLRGSAATIGADQGMVVTGGIWAGAPGGSDIKTKLSTNGVIVQHGTKVAGMSIDGSDKAILSATNFGTDGFQIYLPSINYGMRLSYWNSRTTFFTVDAAKVLPTDAAPLGGYRFSTNQTTPYFEDHPEVIVYKGVNPLYQRGGTTHWSKITGEIEHELTTTNATVVRLDRDFIGNGCYEISTMATITGTTDIFYEKRITVMNGPYISVLSTIVLDSVLATYTSAALVGIQARMLPYLDAGNNNAYLEVTGLAATTIHWKIKIKRMIV